MSPRRYRCQLVIVRETRDASLTPMRYWAASDLAADVPVLVGQIAAISSIPSRSCGARTSAPGTSTAQPAKWTHRESTRHPLHLVEIAACRDFHRHRYLHLREGSSSCCVWSQQPQQEQPATANPAAPVGIDPPVPSATKAPTERLCGAWIAALGPVALQVRDANGRTVGRERGAEEAAPATIPGGRYRLLVLALDRAGNATSGEAAFPVR